MWENLRRTWGLSTRAQKMLLWGQGEQGGSVSSHEMKLPQKFQPAVLPLSRVWWQNLDFWVTSYGPRMFQGHQV